MIYFVLSVIVLILQKKAVISTMKEITAFYCVARLFIFPTIN